MILLNYWWDVKIPPSTRNLLILLLSEVKSLIAAKWIQKDPALVNQWFAKMWDHIIMEKSLESMSQQVSSTEYSKFITKRFPFLEKLDSESKGKVRQPLRNINTIHLRLLFLGWGVTLLETRDYIRKFCNIFEILHKDLLLHDNIFT